MYFYITNAEDYEPREKTRRIPQGKKYKLGWFEDQDWQSPVLSFFATLTNIRVHPVSNGMNIGFDERTFRFDVRFLPADFTHYFYITNAEDYEPREKTRRIPKGKNTNSDGLRIRTGNRRSFLFIQMKPVKQSPQRNEGAK